MTGREGKKMQSVRRYDDSPERRIDGISVGMTQALFRAGKPKSFK